MGLFDINDEKLQAFYHRALVEANYGFVNPRKYPYLDRAIMQYARENSCSYDDVYIPTGEHHLHGLLEPVSRKVRTTFTETEPN